MAAYVDPRLVSSVDPLASTLGPATGPAPTPTPLGTAPAAPVQATPLAADVGVPPMLAAPQVPQPQQPPPLTAPAGAIVGPVMRAPTWSTPGGMRRDSVQTVTTPGAGAAIDRAEALYGAAGELDMAAQRELAATADAQTAAQQAAAAQSRALQADVEARERQRQARVDAEAERFLGGVGAAERLTPSLARASRDAVSTPILAIAQIYAAGAAQARGQAAPDLISAAIDRQLSAQRGAYDDARTNAASRLSAYGQLRQMGADAREADLAFAARKRQEQITGLQAQLARMQAPAQRAAAAAEIARQQAKHAAEMAELRGKIGDKLTANEKYQAAQSGGGGLMVPVVMPDGSRQMMSMGDASKYQALMGQTPEQQLKQRELDLKMAPDSLEGRKLAAETARAEAEARKATTGEDPVKEREKASANVASLAGLRDIRAKLEAAGWKFGPKGVERQGSELPGLGTSSALMPDRARDVLSPVGLTPSRREAAGTQSVVQGAVNQYLKAMSGQGVTAGDIPRLENETATTMGPAGNVTGTRDPTSFAEWVMRAQRDLEAQQKEFSPAVRREVEAEQRKLTKALNGGK